MPLNLRKNTGNDPLTYEQLDGNFEYFTGSHAVTGSLVVSGDITGTLLGTASTASFVTLAQTASYVTTAQTASFVALAQTASYVENAQTASFVENAQTASYVENAQTASFVTLAQTASYVTTAQTASFVTLAQTASYVTTAQTASFVTNAQTASFVATAQTASYINPTFISASAAASGFGSGGTSIDTGSFATTGSNVFVGNQTISGSINFGSGSIIQSTGSTLELTPDPNLGTDQYLILDPTGPNHIHIRAGGAIDSSSADLYLGGEKSNIIVRNLDNGFNEKYWVQINSQTGSTLNTWTFDDDGTTLFPGDISTSGNITATSFTGSLEGTASYTTYAENAATASYYDGPIYISQVTNDQKCSLLFTSLTSDGYGYPLFDTTPTLTYNPDGATGTLSLTGSMLINALGNQIIMSNLPTSEPATPGELWLSGSTNNSKFLCVRS
jgi:hypothetical protein